MDSVRLEGPHWTFVTDFYSRPGVASACLALQDRAGVDVVVLLFLAYREASGACAYEPAAVGAADALVAHWRAAAILPLRAVRKALKAADTGVPAEHSESVRRAVQSAEIQAEQLSLAVLAQAFAAVDAPSGVCRQPARWRDIVTDVVAFYAAASGRGSAAIEDPAVQEAIEFLGRAGIPQ